MMELDNYRRAIEWLRRSLGELSSDPANRMVRLSVLQSFEVTYNISEGLLRQAYVSLESEEDAAFVSTRELIFRAHQEGIVLSSPKQWMHYGFVLESMKEDCMYSPSEDFDISSQLLQEFAQELEEFASSLGSRGLAIV